MVIVFLGIGSNLGDRAENINKALENLGKLAEVRILAVSSLLETEPQGASGPNYINAVAKIETNLEPQELLSALQQIEESLGRRRPFKGAPRIIDLDILLYAERVVNSPELNIPHPRMLERDFVIKPLLEIEPTFKDKLKCL